MENEKIIKKLVEEIKKLENKNKILKRYLHILVSEPASFSAERIRYVNGKKTNDSIIQLN